MASASQHPSRRFVIPPTHELRFELESPTDALSITLVSGFAELFGFELVQGASYGFSHEQRGAVWAPGVNGEGAEVEMSSLSSVRLTRSMAEVAGGTDGLQGRATASRELTGCSAELRQFAWNAPCPVVERVVTSGGRYDPSARERALAPATNASSFPPTHVTGSLDTVYVASESAFSTYFNLHLSLSRLRLLARPSSFAMTRDLSQPDDEVAPPRVLVVGERGAGKSTLVKMLANWRNRAERATCGTAKPASGITLVNLDPSDGLWTVPGTIGVVNTSSIIPTSTPAAPFGTSFSSGPPVPFPPPASSSTSSDAPPPYNPPINPDSYAPLLDPLVFFAGHLSPTVNEPHYDLLMQSVADAAKRKVDEAGMGSWKAGWMVDTPGEWVEKKGGGWERVKAAVRAFEINVLLVVGTERSYVEMSKLMSTNKTVTVVRVPKSDGASDPDLPTLSRLQSLQTRSYFYGGPPLTQGLLSPFSIIVRLSDIRIVRVGEVAGTHAPDSALPLGATRLTRDTELVEVDLEGPRAASEVVNRILAVPMAEEERDGQEKVVKGPVMGFVWVSALDKEKKKITLLSPLPGRLPRKTLIVGGIDWIDNA
ncbi:Cleavage polyadenylation factor subunit clp1 [Rhodotorula toruloides]